MRFPGDGDCYPTRDEAVDYQRAYARRLDSGIRTSTTIASALPRDGVWVFWANDGSQSRHVRSWPRPAPSVARAPWTCPDARSSLDGRSAQPEAVS
ncbi:hypothetical protein LUX12_04140 [Streptomyces somaliensis]|uniref:hypothetical protein n=1 Tax=Streptomyces somaliensis TaxID=78355 RepID=UPI0020CBF396|nr:hypothetical protein [Streptomyces somaliensis]MCP9944160.1 hypothetical protein [Streptomyces somaliensis]MCP9962604.1 hypothetical protein [Streptomyces somaliensis]MCP9975433.1 hypothetical protein [Streptomyces somaliensis]